MKARVNDKVRLKIHFEEKCMLRLDLFSPFFSGSGAMRSLIAPQPRLAPSFVSRIMTV